MRLDSEWLETNGNGGFASGCVDGQLRRFWHGLLFQPRKPPRDRLLLVAGLEEYLLHPRMRVNLSAAWVRNRWMPPGGWPDFNPWPVPEWRWEFEGGAVLRKQIFMPHGTTDRVHIVYTLIPSSLQSELKLSVNPLLPFDGEEGFIDDFGYCFGENEGIPVNLYSTAPLEFLRRGDCAPEVLLETERDCEDIYTRELFAGPELGFQITAEKPVVLTFTSADRQELGDPLLLLAKEIQRREELPAPKVPAAYQSIQKPLALAVDQFIVKDHDTGLPTILAGYPWFTDWGRDTMISLPGLCLEAGRPDCAKKIIGHFLHHLHEGLIPNIFPEAGHEPEYNTVDGTLWLVESFFRVYTLEELKQHEEEFEKILEIIEAYRHGTINQIYMDQDCLISAGDPGTQLTWMDVKVNGEVPTPRHGKPVEIQGLWYNALQHVATALEYRGQMNQAREYRQIADQARIHFTERFCLAGQDHLNDVIDRDGKGTFDSSVRPNMVIPFALTHNIIPEEKRIAILTVVTEKLLTGRGLRSLAMEDPQFKGLYAGNRLARDRAYHQGTVWMWLLWPYACGVHQYREAAPDLYSGLEKLAKELVLHFQSEGCLNQCNEIFDGDFPFSPRGCFAQAWSVAALIEVLQRI